MTEPERKTCMASVLGKHCGAVATHRYGARWPWWSACDKHAFVGDTRISDGTVKMSQSQQRRIAAQRGKDE